MSETESCRICFEPDNLIQPCNCTGTAAHVHKECLMKWLKVSKKQECEICRFQYIIIEKEPEKKYMFAGDAIMDNFVLICGFLLFIPFAPIFYYIGLKAKDVYFSANLLWIICVVIAMGRVWMLRTASFWKLCSAIGMSIVSWNTGIWQMMFFDLGISSIFSLLSCACEKYRGTTI